MQVRITQTDDGAIALDVYDGKDHLFEVFARITQTSKPEWMGKPPIELSVYVDSPRIEWVTPKN